MIIAARSFILSYIDVDYRGILKVLRYILFVPYLREELMKMVCQIFISMLVDLN